MPRVVKVVKTRCRKTRRASSSSSTQLQSADYLLFDIFRMRSVLAVFALRAILPRLLNCILGLLRATATTTLLLLRLVLLLFGRIFSSLLRLGVQKRSVARVFSTRIFLINCNRKCTSRKRTCEQSESGRAPGAHRVLTRFPLDPAWMSLPNQMPHKWGPPRLTNCRRATHQDRTQPALEGEPAGDRHPASPSPRFPVPDVGSRPRRRTRVPRLPRGR